jgi:hypothetical protein
VIAAFAEEQGVDQPVVEVELADTARFVLDRIDPAPGSGMITLHVQSPEDDAPNALVVPLGSIRRFELRKAAETRIGVGFSPPPA